MLVDSHCHLDMLDLTPFEGNFGKLIESLPDNDVSHCLCVSVRLDKLPKMLALIAPYDNIAASVGLHPNEEVSEEPSIETLTSLADNPRIIAIGETGLDYYRTSGDVTWQQDRFRVHIQAAQAVKKPLIIHTRQAREDTIGIMQEMQASTVGGVMHCFTETWEMARAALDMGFYISFSGIVTFKNAREVQALASKVPLDRLLIETDAPYLAPIPHRGKANYPGYVKHVAEYLATLRGVSYEVLAKTTTDNYCNCFGQSLA